MGIETKEGAGTLVGKPSLYTWRSDKLDKGSARDMAGDVASLRGGSDVDVGSFHNQNPLHARLEIGAPFPCTTTRAAAGGGRSPP